jgi:hypothetical protein
MKFFFCVLLVWSSAGAFAQGVKANPAPAPDKPIDAKKLLEEIAGNPPKAASEVVGVLKIRNASGKIREIPIKWSIRPGEGDWNDLYQTPVRGDIPAEDLIVIHRAGMPNKYDYRRDGKTVAEAVTNLFLPFATSDFYIADLGLEFLHWPNPKHVKTEMRSNRACYVIDTANPRPAADAYGRVRCWIDTESGGLIRAEAFDSKDKLFKEFEIAHVKKVEGRWQISELVIRNEQTDSKTRLLFDLNVSAAPDGK